MTQVAAVFDVHRTYPSAEDKRDTFIELPHHVPADMPASYVGQTAQGTVSHSASSKHLGRWVRQGLVSCGLVAEDVSRCCFRNHPGSVAGAVNGDDVFVAGTFLGDSKSPDWA